MSSLRRVSFASAVFDSFGVGDTLRWLWQLEVWLVPVVWRWSGGGGGEQMAEGEALRWVQAWMDEGEEEYRRCTGPGGRCEEVRVWVRGVQ